MNKAALRDLETIERIFYDKMKFHRENGLWTTAELFQKQAEVVRVCIVTVQAAENREPDDEKPPRAD